MFNAVEIVRHIVGAPWVLAVVGVFGRDGGLVLVIWPRKTNDILWKAQQGTSPWSQWKASFGVTITIGCLFILGALGMVYGTWEGYQS
jgi:hypothetical protein